MDRRLASLQAGSVASSHTRSARTMRWARQQQQQQSPQAMAQAGRTAPGSSSGRLAGSSLSGHDSSSRGQNAAPQGVLALSSVEEYLEGGELSAEGEQQLCLAYQVGVQPCSTCHVPACMWCCQMGCEGFSLCTGGHLGVG